MIGPARIAERSSHGRYVNCRRMREQDSPRSAPSFVEVYAFGGICQRGAAVALYTRILHNHDIAVQKICSVHSLARPLAVWHYLTNGVQQHIMGVCSSSCCPLSNGSRQELLLHGSACCAAQHCDFMKGTHGAAGIYLLDASVFCSDHPRSVC